MWEKQNGEDMLKLTRCTVILTALAMSLIAETHITGDITGMTFESGGNPYIVEQDILIPEGNKAIIKEGCVFLFKPFTGLTVHGHLIVDGTQANPVIFSSFNDGEYNTASEQLPNPFDWNGILISRESGTVTLKHFGLRFSVYGIKSQNPNIQISNGLFRQNGQFHFTINDKIQFVQDNIPYSYNGNDPATVISDKPTTTEQQQSSDKKGSRKAVKIVRFSCLGVGVAGAAVALVFGSQLPALNDELNRISALGPDAGPDLLRYGDLEDEFLMKRAVTIISGAVSGACLVTFGVTFLF